MVKIAWDDCYIHPLPDGHRFPMLKYELIPAQLLHEGIITEANLFKPAMAIADSVLLTHQQAYWEQLINLTLPAKEQRRIGFPLSAALMERERCIVQGTIDTSLHALQNNLAFNVAGGTHHAGSNWGEGFCLLNDQAIAANYLLHHRLAGRILIIDLDVHQGNGTAEIFAEVPEVYTFSMHGEKNFPFRKEQSDRDIGLEDEVSDQQYLNILSDALSDLTVLKPDFVFYLSGVDVLATDKLGKLSLSKEGCKQRDQLVFKFCRELNVPVQVSMGGGYSLDIKDIVDAHCNTFKVGIDIFE